MQVAPSSALRPVSPHDAGEARRSGALLAAPSPSGVAARAAEQPARAADTQERPARAGLRHWDADREGQLAQAQRAQGYLEQLAGRLQELKTRYGEWLASGGRPGDEAAGLQQPRAALERLWQQRPEASGGALDAQLRFDPRDGARQWFRVRGIDRQTLGAGTPERLGFALPSLPGGLTMVTVEPQQGVEANRRRLDLALAGAGVRVAADAAGEPVFGVAQARWAQVRDHLAVRGEGRRFPDGMAQRVRAEPEPELLTPDLWQRLPQDPAEWRQVLRQILVALDRVRDAQRQVGEVMARAAAGGDALVQAQARDRMQAFSESFAAQAREPRFDVAQALAPALAGMSRERVLALLAAR